MTNAFGRSGVSGVDGGVSICCGSGVSGVGGISACCCSGTGGVGSCADGVCGSGVGSSLLYRSGSAISGGITRGGRSPEGLRAARSPGPTSWALLSYCDKMRASSGRCSCSGFGSSVRIPPCLGGSGGLGVMSGGAGGLSVSLGGSRRSACGSF
jgi:hypothetical protein